MTSKEVVSFMKQNARTSRPPPILGDLHIEIQAPVPINGEGAQTALDDRDHGEEHGSHVGLDLDSV
jgi:hypothetical protein